MKFTRHQIQVLVVLHLVVAVMLTGVILMPKSGIEQNTPVQGEPQLPDNDFSPPDEKVHDKFRSPRITFDEDIFWETNIGGSGNEQVENAYEIGEKLYIIGNTDSTDLDFDENDGGIFLTVLSQNGKPLAYNFYDGRLIKSSICENGIFCLTQKSEKYFACVIDPNGTLKTETQLPLEANETPTDFVFDFLSGGVNIIVEATVEQPPKKRVQVLSLNGSFEATEGVLLQNVFPLDYAAAFPHENGYIIATCATGAKTGELIIYEWKTTQDKLFTMHNYPIANRKYKVADVMPYPSGYVALIIDEKGIPDLLTVDCDLENPTVILLDDSETTGGKLFSDNENNFVFLQRANGTSSMYKMPVDLKNKTELSSFDTQTEVSSFRFTKTDTYFGGKNAFSPVISVLNNQGVLFEKAFGSSTETIKTLLPSDGFIFAVCESGGTSLGVGKNFGGIDIWIAKIRF